MKKDDEKLTSFVKPIQDIILEEELYFEGYKTLEEALRVIKNRGRLYFQENAARLTPADNEPGGIA